MLFLQLTNQITLIFLLLSLLSLSFVYFYQCIFLFLLLFFALQLNNFNIVYSYVHYSYMSRVFVYVCACNRQGILCVFVRLYARVRVNHYSYTVRKRRQQVSEIGRHKHRDDSFTDKIKNYFYYKSVSLRCKWAELGGGLA